MWKREYSKIVPGLNRKAVWKAWVDINRWPEWHQDLESCELNGPFVSGQSFKLKPKGMKPVTIELVDIQEEESFVDCTRFPGAKMYDRHTIEDTPEGLKMTNTLWVTGVLSYVWIWLVRGTWLNLCRRRWTL